MKPTNLKELEDEISRRKDARPKIRASIETFMATKFGITDFWKIADSLFQGQEGFGLCLARQIPTPNIEHTGLFLTVQWLKEKGFNCEFSPLALYGDSYIGGNRYKESLIKLPMIMNSRSPGKLTTQMEKLPGKSVVVEQGHILEEIRHRAGHTLPEHHTKLWKSVIGNIPIRDLTPYFRELALKSLEAGAPRMPKQLYIKNGSAVEKLVYASELNGKKLNRPRAKWYYLLYLFLLVDGHRGLLSTVGDCADVTSWFDDAITEIENVCEFKPLIIDIPVKVEAKGYESLLNEHPVRIHQGPWKDLINPPPCSSSIFDAAEHFQTSLLTLPKLHPHRKR